MIFDKIFDDFLKNQKGKLDCLELAECKLDFKNFFFGIQKNSSKPLINDLINFINRKVVKGSDSLKYQFKRDSCDGTGSHDKLFFDIKDKSITLQKKNYYNEENEKQLATLKERFDKLVDEKEVIVKKLEASKSMFEQGRYVRAQDKEKYVRDVLELDKNKLSEEISIKCSKLINDFHQNAKDRKEINKESEPIQSIEENNWQKDCDESVKRVKSYLSQAGISENDIEKYMNLIYCLFSQTLENKCIVEPLLKSLKKEGKDSNAPGVVKIDIEKGDFDGKVSIDQNKNLQINIDMKEKNKSFAYIFFDQNHRIDEGKMNINNVKGQYVFKLDSKNNQWNIKSGEVSYNLAKKTKELHRV